MMYHVKWEIEVEAESPREAAEKAREIQRDPNSIATFFDVSDYPGDKVTTIELK